MALEEKIKFLKCYIRSPREIGALSPSSQALAAALAEPYRLHTGPVRVLEIGAGTGPITRHLGTILGEEDQLDVCEMQPVLADALRMGVLASPDFAPAVEAGRVRLLQRRVQDIELDGQYDFIISGLPLTAFEIDDVVEIFSTIRRCLKPTGVLSYFEYMGLRRMSRMFSIGKHRKRIRPVSAYLNDNIRKHQFRHQPVLRNVPPARARYLRFAS